MNKLGSTRPGCELRNVDLPTTVENEHFAHWRFEWVRGKSVIFLNCNFSSALFKNCYFHRAEFKKCKFIGATFQDTNLRGAAFMECDFEYAQFRNCLVEAKQLVKNLPAWENTRRELLRGLRKNAESVGELEDVRLYFAAEMDAGIEHWRSAFRQVTGYYKSHYPGIPGRTKALVNLVSLTCDKWFWGYGESPVRLLTSMLLCVALLALFVEPALVMFVPGSGYSASFQETFLIFLGASRLLAPHLNPWLLGLILGSRYLFLGLIASVLLRRFAKR